LLTKEFKKNSSANAADVYRDVVVFGTKITSRYHVYNGTFLRIKMLIVFNVNECVVDQVQCFRLT
jgi:hypothetical protein